jgi:hypothetical protein
VSEPDLKLARAGSPGVARSHGVIAWFAENPVAANLLMTVLLLGGLIQAFGMSAQVFPTIDRCSRPLILES